MSNMSYCRFENVYNDLLECLDSLNDLLSPSEKKYRKKLIELCQEIIDCADDDDAVDEENEEE